MTWAGVEAGGYPEWLHSPQIVRKTTASSHHGQHLPTTSVQVRLRLVRPIALSSLRGQSSVNEPGRVFIARRGRSELTPTILAAGEPADLVERMLRTADQRESAE